MSGIIEDEKESMNDSDISVSEDDTPISNNDKLEEALYQKR